MTKTIKSNKFIVMILIISMLACQSPETKESFKPERTEVINSTLDRETIKSVNNKGVIFKYDLGEKTEFGENYKIDIEYMITNETSKNIYYLNQSCNGLDYYLIIKPDSYKVMPLINCNATWAMISKLTPKESVKFKTQILQLKKSNTIEKIGLDFRAVDKYISFDTLRENPEMVDNIYRSETKIDNVIWENKK